MVKEKKLISVVIPVYNVELYLEQCLESIHNQSYENIEIILINDGSTDESEGICKKWTKKDQRIRYFFQENCGLGPTRNRGIDLARGVYITFVDSDDWVHRDYIKELYYKILIEGADICTCNYQMYNEQNNNFQLLASSLEENVIESNNFQAPNMWRRLYNINLFKKYNIKMPAVPYEDLATYPILVMLAKKRTSVGKVLYYYRINTGKSIMDNLDNIKYYSKALSYLIDEFIRLNLFNDNAEMLLNTSVFHMISGLSRIKRACSKEQYEKVGTSFKKVLDKYFDNWRNIYDNKFWIWGSYNLSRIANYLMLEYDICDKNTKYYGFSSIISLMSNKCMLNRIDHHNSFRLNMLNRDIDKSFKELEFKKDDYLLIDFLEERYDIIKIDDTYITKSEVLDQSTFHNNKYDLIKRNSGECHKLWKDSCLKFIEFLKNKFEIEKIILVEMYLCEAYTKEKEKEYYLSKKIFEINKILFQYYSFFKKNFRGIKVINVPEKINYTDGNFKYGCKPYYLNSTAIQILAQEIIKNT